MLSLCLSIFSIELGNQGLWDNFAIIANIRLKIRSISRTRVLEMNVSGKLNKLNI
jgi:hypothetical protein